MGGGPVAHRHGSKGGDRVSTPTRSVTISSTLLHGSARGRTGAGRPKSVFFACGRFADVLLFSAKSQKSRQSQQSVQVGAVHNLTTVRADLGGKRQKSG